MAQVIRCHRLTMKTSIINGSKVSCLSVAIHGIYQVVINHLDSMSCMLMSI